MLCLFPLGFFESYGVYFDSLVGDFGWSRTLASSVFSLYTGIYSVSAIIMGRLTDRYQPRKLVMVGGILIGLGFFLSSRIESIESLYVFWGLASFGSGALVIPPLSTVVRWFDKKRGLAIGIANSGYGISMFIVPPLATILLSSYGWRIAFMISGILLFGVILFASSLIRCRSESTNSQVQKHSTEGAHPYALFVNRNFLSLYMVFLAANIVITSILVHIVPMSVDMGVSTMAAAFSLGLIGGSSIFGTFVMGAISDVIGRRTTLAACMFAASSMLIWLSWAHDIWMLYSFSIIFGFVTAGLALMAPLTEELLGPGSFGVNLGILSTTVGAGGVVGPMLFGYIFDVFRSYQLGLIVYSLILAVSAILCFLFDSPRLASH
jgi:OFA family oxalate/formate antiporter-like MFS transporter